jgi:membrane-bound ClpP family serine protease
MEGRYVIGLWMLGIILVIVGWYVPGAGAVAWLGGITLAFGAAVALFRRTT